MLDLFIRVAEFLANVTLKEVSDAHAVLVAHDYNDHNLWIDFNPKAKINGEIVPAFDIRWAPLRDTRFPLLAVPVGEPRRSDAGRRWPFGDENRLHRNAESIAHYVVELFSWYSCDIRAAQATFEREVVDWEQYTERRQHLLDVFKNCDHTVHENNAPGHEQEYFRLSTNLFVFELWRHGGGLIHTRVAHGVSLETLRDLHV